MLRPWLFTCFTFRACIYTILTSLFINFTASEINVASIKFHKFPNIKKQRESTTVNKLKQVVARKYKSSQSY